jgi:serine/threonine protein kinase
MLVQRRPTLKAPSEQRSGLLDIHNALQSIKTERSGMLDLHTAKSGVIEINSEDFFSNDLNQTTENREEDEGIDRGSRPELVLDQLKFVALVGKGSFGRVHLAKFQSEGANDELFAVKVLSGARIVDDCMERNAERERDVMLELARTENSPFLLHLYNTFGDNKNCFFVMEYCEGGDLYSASMQGFDWSYELMRYCLGSVILGLDVLRAHNIIHRDIKPENMLITKEGRVKIGDFGICKKATRAFTFVGTPEYMAPVSHHHNFNLFLSHTIHPLRRQTQHH